MSHGSYGPDKKNIFTVKIPLIAPTLGGPGPPDLYIGGGGGGGPWPPRFLLLCHSNFVTERDSLVPSLSCGEPGTSRLRMYKNFTENCILSVNSNIQMYATSHKMM